MKHLEQKLLADRDRLLAEIAARDAEIAKVQIDDSEDKNVERLDDEVLAATTENDRQDLARIDAALARIADGSYGICATCEEPIAEARLNAQPDAILCIDCAS